MQSIRTKAKFSLAALALGTASAIGVAAAPAQATTVTKWEYMFNNYWANVVGGTNVTCTPSTALPNGCVPYTSPTVPTPNPAQQPTTVSWGFPFTTGGPQSSITVDELGATGPKPTVDTSFDPLALNFVPGAKITHSNNVIVSGGEITSLDLISELTLTPNMPNPPFPGAPITLSPAQFNLKFKETDNVVPPGGACADPTSPTPCNDIFVLDTLGGIPIRNFLDPAGQLGVVIPNAVVVMGMNYDFILEIGDPLVPGETGAGKLRFLNTNECTAAGAAAGCIGFTTEEGGMTMVQTKFALLKRSVPEPSSTAALIGVGAVAFGALRKRKETK